MSIPLLPVSLATSLLGTSGFVDFRNAGFSADPSIQSTNKPHAFVYNESGCGLQITFRTGQNGDFLPAGAWKVFELTAGETGYDWKVLYILPGAPVALLLTVCYQPSENVTTPVLGNSPIGIGGNVSTSGSGGTGFILNAGNVPATSIISATPNDQGSASWGFNNDGSGFHNVLSAGSLKNVVNVIRGNTTTGKSATVFGDSTDVSISTFYGQSNATGLMDSASTYVAPFAADTTFHLLVVNNQSVTPFGFVFKVWDGFNQRSGFTLNQDATVNFAQNTIVISNSGIFTAIPNNAIPASAINGIVSSAKALSGGPVGTYSNGGALIVGISTEMPASSARSFLFQSWDGAVQHNVLAVGSVTGVSTSTINDNGDCVFNSVNFKKHASPYYLSGVATFSGTGPGTVTHQGNSAPAFVGINSNVLNSTYTVGVDSINATTFHVNILGGIAWVALAIWTS